MDEFNILKELAKSDDALEPNRITYSIMMDVFSKIGNMEAASEILESIVKSGRSVDTIMINTVLHGYRLQGDAQKVNHYFKAFPEYGVAPNSDTYSILLSLHGLDERNFDQAMKIYNTMIETSGLAPNRSIIANMLTICIVNGRYEKAREWYQTLIDRGMVPHSTILQNMIKLQILDSPKSKMLENGLFYYNIAKEMNLVNASMLRTFAVLHLLSGTSFDSTIRIYDEEREKLKLSKYTPKDIYVFADYVLRRDMFLEEHVKHNFQTPAPNEPTKEPIQRLVGKKEFKEMCERGSLLRSLRLDCRAYFELAMSNLD